MKKSVLCGFVLILMVVGPAARQTVPATAESNPPFAACGLGQYWIVDDNIWDGVWIREGQSDTFKARWSFSGEADITATLKIALDGEKVTVERTDDPNKWVTYNCSYTGTLGADGVSVTGTDLCNTDKGPLGPLDWSATISCGMPVIAWSNNLNAYRAAKNQEFSFLCLPGGTAYSIWGTDVYTADSSICTAAVHAGVITLDQGGPVTVEILPGQDAYTGSIRNDVASTSYDAWVASFRLAGLAAGQTPVIGTAFTMTSYRGHETEVTFNCLPLPQPGSIWGTTIYTDDSSVCTAAVHAGVIGMGGGMVTVQTLPGQAFYEGSTHNDIASRSYGVWEGSFGFAGLAGR